MDWIDVDAYRDAAVDPVLPRRHGITQHMNDDHADAGILLCQQALVAADASTADGHHGDDAPRRPLRLRVRRRPRRRRPRHHPARLLGDRRPRPTTSAGSSSSSSTGPAGHEASAPRSLVALLVAGATACGGDDDDGSAARRRRDRGGHRCRRTAVVAAVQAPATGAVERIIPVNGDLAEVVYALGLGDQVVATDISATYPAEAQATPKIGYQRALVAETILVVRTDGRPGRRQRRAARGARPGARRPASASSTCPTSRRSSRCPRRSAPSPTRSPCPSGARSWSTTFEDELDAATARADAAVAASGRPKVLALYLRGTNVQLVFGEGSGIDAVIAAAGGTDLGTEMGVVDNAELSTEAIVAAAPDILLVTTTGLESVGGVDGLLAIPGIDQTPAAADRRVVAFEDQYLYGLGPRTGHLVGELVDAFHPAP